MKDEEELPTLAAGLEHVYEHDFPGATTDQRRMIRCAYYAGAATAARLMCRLFSGASIAPERKEIADDLLRDLESSIKP